uniref:Uncharacterized protein n=1 Tax=Digenea simplex TaxID=945030 RepID=A0A1Z1MUX5_DIGSM|nr:hypothetical protein [Digenea simplex]ARW69632.1 hypothetical protein [Digenea simplex]
MKNNIYLKKKLDLLIASLETLDNYYINNPLSKIDFINEDNKNIITRKFLTKNRFFRNFFHKKYYLTDIIKYIYTHYIYLNKDLLHQSASKVLKHYIKYNEIDALDKYNKKFNYLYNEKEGYYSYCKLISDLYNIKINRIAILNIYLLTKIGNNIKKDKGPYFLIKYLYK